MRLRIAWSGGAPRAWQGAIRANGAQFSALQALAVEPDAAASFVVLGDQVQFRAESPRARDGLDLSVTGDLDAVLVIEFDIDGSKRTVVEAPLRQLVSESVAELLDQGHRITVARVPGDRLQVEFDRESLVFSPGEQFAFAVRPHLLGPPGAALKLKAQLVAQPGEQRLWSRDVDARAAAEGERGDAVSLDVALPEAEGVYELWISAIHPGIKERLPWKKPLAERRVQLMVVGKSAANSTAPQPLAKALEIDPANPKWWDRLSTNLSLTSALRRWNLSSGDSAKWEHPRLGALVQLNPATDAASQAWEAYPLPTAAPGQPHIVEVEYPSDVPQTIGLAVVESASGGTWSVVVDSGLFVPDEDADQPPALLKHRLVYWPKSKTPLLLVTNRRPGMPAVYGKIRVLAAPAPQFASINLAKSPPATMRLPVATAGAANERVVAALIEHPAFLRQLGGEDSQPGSPQAVDSWRGIHQASTRLVEYLQYAGYNGLVLGAAVEGATLYPSDVLGTTPRWDAGLLSPWAHDPQQKDVLELLFRLFDREQLTLIPLIDLCGPIAELEALRREDAGRDGIAWVTSAGMSSETVAGASGGPRYNPLHPRVQRALVAAARELAERYGGHPSFGGLAIQLGPGSCVQLASADGGFDDDTIMRFQRAVSRKVPGSGERRFAQRAQFLLGEARADWLAWRSESLSGLHQQMLHELRAAGEQTNLYFSLPHCWDGAAAQSALQPSLPPQLRPEEVLLEQGLRPELYRRQEGFVLLRPCDAAPRRSLVSDAVKIELNLATDLDRLFLPLRPPAASCYHPTQTGVVHLPEQHGLWETVAGETPLSTTLSPSGDRARQRLVHALATLDAETLVTGGESLPLGQEDQLRDLLITARQLPRGRFETVSAESQPVVVRTLSRDQATYAYLANDSPWQATVSLVVEMPGGCRVERLGANRPLPPLSRAGEGWSWTASLKPYELLAVRFTAPRVRLSRPKVALGENVQLALQRRIGDLGSRVAALANPAPLDVPTNPSFEADAKNGLPGWTFDAASEGSATLDDRTEARGGARSLRLASAGRQAILRSDPFAAPVTGRLGVHVWLRAGKLSPSARLLLAIEGYEQGKLFQRYAVLGGDEPEAIRISDRWAPYVFQVSDLPDAGLEGLHLRFELAGQGEVSIDDVRLFDLSFNEIEQVELTKIVSLANFKLQAGQVGDCARILDGFWPHYLVTHVPLTEGPHATAQRTRRPNERARELTPAATGKRVGVFDRVRDFVPRLKPKNGRGN